MKIDTSNWGKFRIGDLFDYERTGNIPLRLIVEDANGINYVTAQAGNNGIQTKIRRDPSFKVTKGNCVFVGGKTFTVYYQDDDFISNDSHNFVMRYNQGNLSRLQYLYVASVIRTIGEGKYKWSDSVTANRLTEEIMLLPVDKNGNPDWNYIENFMINIERETDYELDCLCFISNKRTNVDIDQWQEYIVGDLLRDDAFVSPHVYNRRDVIEDPNGIPYVVRSKYNNGISFRVVREQNMITNPAGVISWGAENPTFFYQSEEWCSGRDIYYIDTRHLSKYACYFLISCLSVLAPKYAYNNGLFPKLLKQEKIKLPSKNGAPDWEYMNQYMQEVERTSGARLNMLSIIAGH